MLKNLFILLSVMLLLGTCWIGRSSADEIVYDDGSAENAWNAVVPGWQFAVCFTPPSYPCNIKKVKFYVMSPLCGFDVHIYTQESANDPPRLDLITSFLVTPSADGWFEVIMPEDISILSGNFAISMEYISDAGCPSIGFDLTPPISNRSWMYNFSFAAWLRVDHVVENANIMIRALVEYPTISSTTTIKSTTTSTPPSPTTTIKKCPLLKIYGEDSEEVEILRYIRDSVLSQTPTGKELIKLYYQWSPVIVKAMENDEKFKEEVKEMIDGVLVLVGGEIY